MKKSGNIQLVPGAHVPCMRTWCEQCKTTVRTCKAIDGGELSQCPHIDKLSYRFVGFRPGTKERVVRSLGKNFNEAVKQVAILRQQLETEEVVKPAIVEKHTSTQIEVQQPAQQATDQVKPTLLIHVFGRYYAFLKNQGVPSHLQVERTSKHINDVKNFMKKFCKVLKAAKYDLRTLAFSSVNDHLIGHFHAWLEKEEFAPRTKNKFWSYLTSIASWAEQEGYGDIRKCIERVPRNHVDKNPGYVSKSEFETFIGTITPENGFHLVGKKRSERKQLFTDYLVSAYTYALLVGRRTEEIIECKWKHVHLDPRGEPLFIEFSDFKASRIKHLPKGKELKVFNPATAEVKAFLYAHGFTEKKESDEYILAPTLIKNRVNAMKSALSRGFSHYWKVAFPNSQEQRTFGNLRDTYWTSLKKHMRGEIRGISGHSDESVLDNYLDQKELAASLAQSGFAVHGREAELKSLRKENDKTQGIER